MKELSKTEDDKKEESTRENVAKLEGSDEGGSNKPKRGENSLSPTTDTKRDNRRNMSPSKEGQ